MKDATQNGWRHSGHPTIIIDTREQEPYCFDSCSQDPVNQPVMQKRATLQTGDYSLEGMEDLITVERKSLDDFVGWVIRNKKRCVAELKRMQEYRAACVVVEASIMDILRSEYTSNVHPHSVIGNVDSILINWGIPVYCVGDRQRGVRFVWEWLLREGMNR